MFAKRRNLMREMVAEILGVPLKVSPWQDNGQITVRLAATT